MKSGSRKIYQMVPVQRLDRSSVISSLITTYNSDPNNCYKCNLEQNVLKLMILDGLIFVMLQYGLNMDRYEKVKFSLNKFKTQINLNSWKREPKTANKAERRRILRRLNGSYW